jgi:hypothetical protein
MSDTATVTEYKTFAEFYPFYLSQHQNRTCRILHFIGTTTVVALAATAFATHMWFLLGVAFVQAYAWAWVGHFIFEHNRPATFQYPLKSFLGDWRMWFEMLTGKIKL